MIHLDSLFIKHLVVSVFCVYRFIIEIEIQNIVFF